MKTQIILFSILALTFSRGEDAKATGTVALDAIGVKNLRIETVDVEETDFEETVFALGRIEVLPGKKGIVSSRVSGRAKTVIAMPDMQCDEGDELVWIESRQPGDPPPVVRLDAPLTGIISKVNVAVGQPVDPGDSLVEIMDLSTVEAAAAVPEHLAGKLSKGQIAHIRLPAFPDQVFEAELAHLGAEGDVTAGTIEAAFHVLNSDLKLRPGMRAEFSIVVSKREGVMSVPRSALLGEATNRFVFVRNSDPKLPNVFLKTSVEVGQINDRFAEIVSGLFPADSVVTRGGYSLSFAGGGSISLKEVLDAAHGHEHAEDGGELTPEKKAEMEAKKKGVSGGNIHAEGGTSSLWMYSTIILLVLLLILVSTKQRPAASDENETPMESIKKEAH